MHVFKSKLITETFEITSAQDLVAYEERYNELISKVGMVWNDECECFDSPDFHEGELCLLSFTPFSSIINLRDESYEKWKSLGLDLIQIMVVRSYLQRVSAMYRPDAYPYGIPPFAKTLIDLLQSALQKLPECPSIRVVRHYNDHDKNDFKIGEIFTPIYSLTTSANPEWNDGSWGQYIIETLPSGKTKAHSLIYGSDWEQQVTFLIGASFEITNIEVNNEGEKRVFMKEI